MNKNKIDDTSSNDDSDNEFDNKNCEITLSGYELLREDVETVIIHSSSDCDENLDKIKYNENETNKILLNLPSEKFKLNNKKENLLCKSTSVKNLNSVEDLSLKTPNIIKSFNSFNQIKENLDEIKLCKEIDDDTQRLLSTQNSILMSTIKIDNQEKTSNIFNPLDRMVIKENNSYFQASQNNSSGIYRFLEEKYKCKICRNPYLDPRILNCLHTFCKQCLINIEYEKNSTSQSESNKQMDDLDLSDYNFKTGRASYSESVTSHEFSNCDPSNENKSRTGRRKSFFNMKFSFPKDNNGQNLSKEQSSHEFNPLISNKIKIIICPICKFETVCSSGSINFLPRNYILSRKTEEALSKIGADSSNSCSLCTSDMNATFFCITCNLNLCAFCNVAHTRQRITANHEIKSFHEIRKSSNAGKYKDLLETRKKRITCSIHKFSDIKLFCIPCKEILCNDCLILTHTGHKCEPITRAMKIYLKQIKSSLEKIRPLSDYATHTILNLNEILKKINKKCDKVQNQVEQFLNEYFIALELHQTTLNQQISRYRQSKIDSIKQQQIELEKKSNNAKDVIQFTEDLLSNGSDIEILTCLGVLLKQFEHLQTPSKSLNSTVTDSVQFLSEIQAPNSNSDIKIPLFGIITTQTVVPKFCCLETKDLINFRIHKKSQVVVISKDNDERQLCHGGLTLSVELRYKDSSARIINTYVTDKRDGTYIITFTPDTAGLLNLSILIKGRHIFGSPFTLKARNLRRHTGIYHCCTFCSSNGSKDISCACGGVMNGYRGCGHGHEGHPGRRHWSCCANILENSECSKVNNNIFGVQ